MANQAVAPRQWDMHSNGGHLPNSLVFPSDTLDAAASAGAGSARGSSSTNSSKGLRAIASVPNMSARSYGHNPGRGTSAAKPKAHPAALKDRSQTARRRKPTDAAWKMPERPVAMTLPTLMLTGGAIYMPMRLKLRAARARRRLAGAVGEGGLPQGSAVGIMKPARPTPQCGGVSIVVWVLGLAFLVMYSGFAPAKEYMTTVFADLKGASGLTVKEVAYAVGGLVAPLICEFTGPRVAMFLAAVVYALFMVALTAAFSLQSSALVISASAVLGAGTAVLWTSTWVVVHHYCSDHNRGRTHAVFLSMYNANALGLFLVKIVLSDNWSTAFIVLTLVTSTGAACIGILWVALWLIEAAAKRKEAKVRAAKATIIGATLVEEEDGGDDDDDEPFSLWSALRESIWGAITTLWLHRTLRHLLPTVFMYGFTRGIVSSVMTKHIADTLGKGSVTSDHVGYMAGGFSVFIVVGGMIGGFVRDKFQARNKAASREYLMLFLPLGLFLAGLALLMYELWALTGWLTYVCAVLLGLAVGMCSAILMAVISWQTKATHEDATSAAACRGLHDAIGRAAGSVVKVYVPSPWEPVAGIVVGILAVLGIATWPRHKAGTRSANTTKSIAIAPSTGTRTPTAGSSNSAQIEEEVTQIA